MFAEKITPSFNYAAANYLFVWLSEDGPVATEFQKKVEVMVLQKFLTHYKVARTLRGSGPHRLKFFVDQLNALRGTAITRKNCVSIVTDFAECMNAHYKGRCVSAVSKALWMLRQHPIAILDSVAQKSLEQQFKHRSLSTYAKYYDAWWEEYKLHTPQITAAQKWLVNSRFVNNLVYHGFDRGYLERVIGRDFFANRIFDLWLVGLSNRPTNAEVAVYVGPNEDP